MEKESGSQGRESRIERDFGRYRRRDIEKFFLNPNCMPLGYGKDPFIQGNDTTPYLEKEKRDFGGSF